MSDIVVGLTLRADGRGFVGEVRNARTELDRLRGGGVGAASALDDLRLRSTSAIGSLRGLQATVAGLGLALGVREAVQEFAVYEKALVGVAKTANLTAGQVADMADAITEMARRMPFARAELLEVAQAGGQLGVKGVKDLSLFTETIAKLGTASDLAGAEAATALTRILNVTGESISSIDRFASVIVALGNDFAASESEIARVATQVAQASSVFGVSAAQAAAMAAALKSIGVQAELGGSAVGRSFRAIDAAIRGGGERLTQLEKITGLAGDKLKQTFASDATQVFRLFVEGLGKVVASGASAAGTLERFGLEGEEILKVLPPVAKNSELLGRALNLAAREAGDATALNEEFGRSAKTLASELKLTGNAVDEIAAGLGASLAPAIIQATQDFRAFVQAAIDSGDAKAAFETVAQAAGLLANNLDLLAGAGAVAVLLKLRPALAGVLSAVSAAGAAAVSGAASWTALNAAVAKGTVVDIASARAAELKAGAQAAAAAQSLAAARAAEAAAAAELVNVRALQATIAAERQREVQRLAAQISDKGRQQSIARLVALRADEAAAARLVAAAEGQLAAARAAAAASAGAATRATVAHSAAMAAATLGARTAAVATRALSGAMALLGGPAGLALLAAGAIYLLSTRETEAAEATRSLAEATETLNGLTESGVPPTSRLAEAKLKEAVARRENAKAILEELEARFSVADALPSDFGGTTAGDAEQIDNLRKRIAEAQAAIDRLKQSAAGVGDAVTTATTGGRRGDGGSGGLSSEVRALVDQLDPLTKVTREAANAAAQLNAAQSNLVEDGRDLGQLLAALRHDVDAYAYSLGAAARAARDQATDLALQAQVRRLEVDGTETSRRAIIELTAARELEKIEAQRVQAVMAAQLSQVPAINAAYAALKAIILATRDADLAWSAAQATAFRGLRDRLDPVAAKYREVAQQQELLNDALSAGQIGLEEHARLTARLSTEIQLWLTSQAEAVRSIREQAEDQELANRVRRLELEDTEEARRRIIDLTTARRLERLEIERNTALLAANRDQVDAVNAAYDRLRRAIMDDGQVRQLERIRAQADPLAEAFKNAAQNIQRGFSDALASIFRGGRGGFKSMLDAWKDAFARMLAEMATLALLRPVIVPIVSAAGSALGLSAEAVKGVTKSLGGGTDLLSSGSSIISSIAGAPGRLATSFATSSIGQTLGLSAPTFTAFDTVSSVGGTALASGGQALTSAGSALVSAAPFIAIGLAIATVLAAKFFKKTPSSGPVAIADFFPGAEDPFDDNKKLVTSFTADNGGDPEAIRPLAEAIAESIKKVAETFEAAIDQTFRLRVANYVSPQSGNPGGRVQGIEINTFIANEAEKRRASGLSEEDAVDRAILYAVRDAFDFQEAILDAVKVTSKAETGEQIVADLEFASHFQDLIDAIDLLGTAVDGSTLAMIDLEESLKTQGRDKTDAFFDELDAWVEKARELFSGEPFKGGSGGGTTTQGGAAATPGSFGLESAVGTFGQTLPQVTLATGLDDDSRFFRFGKGVTGLYGQSTEDNRDPKTSIQFSDPSVGPGNVVTYDDADTRGPQGLGFRGLQIAGVNLRGIADEGSGTWSYLVEGANEVIQAYTRINQNGVKTLVVSTDALIGALQRAGATMKEIADATGNTQAYLDQVARTGDAIDVARTRVAQYIDTLTGKLEPPTIGAGQAALIEGTAALEAARPRIEALNDEIRAAYEEMPELADTIGALADAVLDADAIITQSIVDLRAQITEALYDQVQQLENDAAGHGAINQLGDLIEGRDLLLADAGAFAPELVDRINAVFGAQVRQALSGLNAEGLAAAYAQTTDDVARSVIAGLMGSLASEAASAEVEAALADLATARSTLVDAYRREADTLKALSERMAGFARSLREFLGDLRRGDLAPGGPRTRRDLATAHFDATFASAIAGDETALAALQQAATDFLEATRAVTGDGGAYNAAFALVETRLETAAAAAEAQATAADQQLQQMTAQVGEMVELNDNVVSVEQAIVALQAVSAGGFAAMASALAQGRSPSAAAAAAGYNFGQAQDVNKLIYDTLVAQGLPVPAGFGPGVAGNLAALRAQNAAVDAAVKRLGYEGGGWHPGGIARIHNDELLYTGPPMHVFNARESAALMGRAAERQGAMIIDFDPVVSAIGATTRATEDGFAAQADAIDALSGRMALVERGIAEQGRELRDTAQLLRRRAS